MYEPVRTTYFVGGVVPHNHRRAEPAQVPRGYQLSTRELIRVGRIGGHRRHESKRAQHSQSRTFCSFHTTISHDSRPTQAGSSFGLSGTFHDANETPALGLSFVVNCSRFVVRSDAVGRRATVTGVFVPISALPRERLIYSISSSAVMGTRAGVVL